MNHPLLRTSVCLLLFLALLSGCTTERDGFTYRTFHNTTAHFNGYYNAKNLVLEGEMALLQAHKDDYEYLLPIFIYGDEESATAVYGNMENAIEKASLVIERHKMEVPKRYAKKSKRPELNKWMDENYFVIGQAYFYKRSYYKAEELFQYVIRKYKQPEAQIKSGIWMARSQIEREAYTEARRTLEKAENTKDFPEELRAEFNLVFADYYIRLGDYEKAAEKMEVALRYIKKRKERHRPAFIYAQLLQKQEKANEAIDAYEQVIRLRPPYEMKFYAQINQALAYDRKGGNSDAIKEKLFKMLKDDKNIEYRDQIHYALGEIYLEERNKDVGVYHLLESASANVGNQTQKAKTFLRLSDLYFDDREYALAQAYYDSTARTINPEHLRYDDVKNKAESLTELVGYIELVETEDSLRMLCSLSEEDLKKKLKEVRKEQIDILTQKKLEEEAALAAALNSGDANSGAGEFWVYNSAIRANGMKLFQERWGDRILEDNWRRSLKMRQSFEDEEEEIVAKSDSIASDIVKELSIEEQVATVDEMKAGLPCSPEEIMTSVNKSSEALYLSGVIYKEKLKDYENAVESWEVLISNSTTSDYHPTAMYQLYRTYLFKEQEEDYDNPFCETCSSVYWANQLRTYYPTSDWVKLVDNPDYLDFKELKEAEEREAYELVYKKYRKKYYIDVIMECNETIQLNDSLEGEDKNHLLCKYRLLKALSIGYMDAMAKQRVNLKPELENVINNCPGTEESKAAEELLLKLFEEEKNEKQKEVEPEPKDTAEVEEPSIFTYNDRAKHYIALVVSVKGSDANAIKADISDFNQMNYASSGLKVSSTLLNKTTQIILIKSFLKLDDGKGYYKHFVKAKETSDARKGGSVFIISKENYITLFKTKELEAYKEFFEKEYK